MIGWLLVFLIVGGWWYFHDGWAVFRGIVAQHQSQWTSQGIRDYRFAVDRICLCPDDKPKIFEIRDGKVITPIEDDWEDVSTVDKLFEVIESGIQDEVAVLNVDYDPALGYPREIYIKWHVFGHDDNVTYRVTKFEKLQP